jgi:hypothetical protein
MIHFPIGVDFKELNHSGRINFFIVGRLLQGSVFKMKVYRKRKRCISRSSGQEYTTNVLLTLIYNVGDQGLLDKDKFATTDPYRTYHRNAFSSRPLHLFSFGSVTLG